MRDLDQKTNLLGMDQKALSAFFVSLGHKPFRATQLMKWLYQAGVDSFGAMTNLPKSLIATLEEVACIAPPIVHHKEFSEDGTRKWVFAVAGGALVETVLIPAQGRKTLCISSQVGCALDCHFCSTGKQGFERNLSTSEIIGQLYVANRSFMDDPAHYQNDSFVNPITNVVMMGMGEPLLNYAPVVGAMRLMLDDYGYGLSKRRVTLSTSGVVPAMHQLNQDIDVALAVSLHAPNDALRNQIMPINKKYPLQMLLGAMRDYLNTNPRHKKHVTIEYVLLKDINDQDTHARELIALLEGIPVKINLIPFNPFAHAPYARPSNNRIHAFSQILQNAGLVSTIRQTRGDDIDAACGQLVGQVADRTRRAARWQNAIAKDALQGCKDT